MVGIPWGEITSTDPITIDPNKSNRTSQALIHWKWWDFGMETNQIPQITVDLCFSDPVYNFIHVQEVSTHPKKNSLVCTPWKINMEPTNHPFRKENDLPNPHDYVPC